MKRVFYDDKMRPLSIKINGCGLIKFVVKTALTYI